MLHTRPARIHWNHSKQLFCRGRITTHHLVRLEERPGRHDEMAMFPVYRCEESGIERHYGYLRPDLSLDELEFIFGALNSCSPQRFKPTFGLKADVRRAFVPARAAAGCTRRAA